MTNSGRGWSEQIGRPSVYRTRVLDPQGSFLHVQSTLTKLAIFDDFVIVILHRRIGEELGAGDDFKAAVVFNGVYEWDLYAKVWTDFQPHVGRDQRYIAVPGLVLAAWIRSVRRIERNQIVVGAPIAVQELEQDRISRRLRGRKKEAARAPLRCND